MKISLSHEVERLLAEQMQSGHYQSAEEVLRDGLVLLQERGLQGRISPANSGTDLMTAFARIAEAVPEADWQTVPTDLSKNLDRYLYDGQKKS